MINPLLDYLDIAARIKERRKKEQLWELANRTNRELAEYFYAQKEVNKKHKLLRKNFQIAASKFFNIPKKSYLSSISYAKLLQHDKTTGCLVIMNTELEFDYYTRNSTQWGEGIFEIKGRFKDIDTWYVLQNVANPTHIMIRSWKAQQFKFF